MCEGWSIEIGIAFHGSVVRRDRSGEPRSCKLVVDSVIQFVQEHLLLCLLGCELRHGFLLLMQATGAPKSTTFNRSDAASHALL
jgi:hypothetical protein